MPGGNFYLGGRTKGSKNKNPYPMTDLVIERLKKLNCYLKDIGHHHRINIEWWTNASDEAKDKRIRNWLNKDKIKIIYTPTNEDYSSKEYLDMEESLNKIFDI